MNVKELVRCLKENGLKLVEDEEFKLKVFTTYSYTKDDKQLSFNRTVFGKYIEEKNKFINIDKTFVSLSGRIILEKEYKKLKKNLKADNLINAILEYQFYLKPTKLFISSLLQNANNYKVKNKISSKKVASFKLLTIILEQLNISPNVDNLTEVVDYNYFLYKASEKNMTIFITPAKITGKQINLYDVFRVDIQINIERQRYF